MRGGAADRWGNPRTDAVTWSSLGSGVTVSSAGVVTATALGRYQIKADGVLNGVNGTSSGWVSVVPPGRLAVVGISADFQSMNLFAVDMDGSNKITLATVTDGGIGVHPAWIPGTSTVAYTTVVGGYQKLFTVGADGVPTPFFSSTPAGVTHQAEPTPTADGKWIYFSAYDTQCSQFDYCVARAKVDGSGYQLLVPSPSRQPAPSPDGSKVAFVSPNDYSLRVLDVASNTVSTWSVFGSTPTWSPDGTRIAYRDNTGSVSVVSPDGTGQRVLSTTSTSRVFGWSPDNKWVLMQTNNGTALLDAVSGTTLPVSSPLNSVPWSMK
jgi:Tol biopolymer transport system component